MDYSKLLGFIPRKMMAAFVFLYAIYETAKLFGITAEMKNVSWQATILMSLILLGEIFLAAFTILLHYRGSLNYPEDDAPVVPPAVPK